MFLAREDTIKIGDMGVARELAHTAHMAHTVVGTPYYLSPELCEEKPYNYKSDMWSLGCVLYELCTLRKPFEATNQGALALKILRANYCPIPATYSRSMKDLVNKLLTKDYRTRPDIEQVLRMDSVAEKMRLYGYELPSVESLKLGRNPDPNCS